MTNAEWPRNNSEDNEVLDNPENFEISDDDLIATLKLGAEQPKAKQMLTAFCEREENKILENDSMEARVGLDIRLGRIYIKAGYIEQGLYSLKCALVRARHEGSPELVKSISAEIEKVIEDSGEDSDTSEVKYF